MEASAIPASAGLARTRIATSGPLLRIRSDEQLVSQFRSGNEEAFRAIHDRYRQRLLAYTRQMLAGSAVEAEDAVQEVFVRAYAGLRANNRELALRAWLYRIAHNRCIDELRRPCVPTSEAIEAILPAIGGDPASKFEQRDALRRLIADVQRLPEQQRSALLMRELGGMTYADMAGALGISIPAIKSLLVRARVGLAQASEARETACGQIRAELIIAHDRGVRASGLARRHMRDCPSCRAFRGEVRGVSRQLAALIPPLGPIGVIAKLLGIGSAGSSGAAAGSTAVAGGGATAAVGTATGGGAAASFGALAGAGHVATLLAAAVVTAGGAIELQHLSPSPHHANHRRIVRSARATSGAARRDGTSDAADSIAPPGGHAPTFTAAVVSTGVTSAAAGAALPAGSAASGPTPRSRPSGPRSALMLSIDPDTFMYPLGASATGTSTGTGSSSTSGSTGGASTTTPGAPGSGTTTTTGSGTPGGTTGGGTSSTGTGTPATTGGGTQPAGAGSGGSGGSAGSGAASGSGGTGGSGATAQRPARPARPARGRPRARAPEPPARPRRRCW